MDKRCVFFLHLELTELQLNSTLPSIWRSLHLPQPSEQRPESTLTAPSGTVTRVSSAVCHLKLCSLAFGLVPFEREMCHHASQTHVVRSGLDYNCSSRWKHWEKEREFGLERLQKIKHTLVAVSFVEATNLQRQSVARRRKRHVMRKH